MDVTERLSFFASLLKVDQNPKLGMWLLFAIIFILTCTVYKLGFSFKIPVLKEVIIYLVIGLGCIIFTFLGIFLPVAEGLAIAAILLVLYKIRIYMQQKNKANES